MKLSKFLSIAVFITFFSILYVYQQTEIFRFAYLGQKKQAFFDEVLDKNCVLRYNIEKNASLVCIGEKISGYADFQMPEDYQMVTLFPAGAGPETVSPAAEKPGLLAMIFGAKRQAEAKDY